MRKLVEFQIMRRGEACAEEVSRVKALDAYHALESYRREHPEARMGYYAIRPAKPSGEMLHVLQLASQQGANIHWVPLVDGKGSQSRTVGRGLTVEACQRRGWLDYQGNLTPLGRTVRNEAEEKLARVS